MALHLDLHKLNGIWLIGTSYGTGDRFQVEENDCAHRGGRAFSQHRCDAPSRNPSSRGGDMKAAVLAAAKAAGTYLLTNKKARAAEWLLLTGIIEAAHRAITGSA